jgi:hypothetical protein
MRAIIEGVAYDTDSCAPVARWRLAGRARGGLDEEMVLYRTPAGTFFLHTRRTGDRRGSGGEREQYETNDFGAVDRERAQRWAIRHLPESAA